MTAGFVTTGSITSARQPSSRTFLQAVELIMRSCGMPTPGSVDNPDTRTSQAMSAVNLALDRVWYFMPWSWRIGWAYLNWGEYQMMYPLPGDWDQPYGCLLTLKTEDNVANELIRIVPYAEILEHYPMLRIPANAQIAEGGLDEVSKVVSMLGDEGLLGKPKYAFIVGGQMGFLPVPGDGIVEGFDIDCPALVKYFYRRKELTENTDPLAVPHDLYGAVHFLALGYFKQYSEYGDWQHDEARGERYLAEQAGKARLAEGIEYSFI